MAPVSVMGVLHCYRSNRTEVLADALAAVVRQPLRDPLAREWLVVQGRGMATWLALAMAERLGVWAGGGGIFPRAFVRAAFAAVLGDAACDAGDAFSRERLHWAIAQELPRLLDKPEFAWIASHLEHDDDRALLFALAERIADALDGYLTYRPEFILAWERGDDSIATKHDEAWQPILWRALLARKLLDDETQVAPVHTASLERAFYERLYRDAAQAGDAPLDVDGPAAGDAARHGNAPVLVDALPERIVVFGLTTLPPFYLRAMLLLARHVDVHWFQLSPSRHAWSEEVQPRLKRRLARDGKLHAGQHLDQIHPLLSSLGAVGAEADQLLFESIESLGVESLGLDAHEPEDSLYVAPAGGTLLERLQRDIVESTDTARCEPGDGATDDRTISILACHGPVRELEVLHDELLLLFDGGDLRPENVVVMVPDLERFAPLIEAVFERDGPTKIPYRIADRQLRPESPLLDAFQRVLELAGTRLSTSSVFDVLALEPLRSRFSIEAGELDKLMAWTSQCGVRWGIDREHRATHVEPPTSENTWEFGLTRMLLGFAMPGAERALFAGVLPFDEIEGGDALLLGRFARFAAKLFETTRALDGLRSIDAWRELLTRIVCELFTALPHQSFELERIHGALGELASLAKDAAFDGLVGIRTIRKLIASRIEAGQGERGFLKGGVTFCAMMPMRAIPFDVVCLVGMNDGAFPRGQHASELDIGAREGRKAGDRSRREDDRYLFLEAILSARRRLIITYSAISLRDRTELLPSSVVSELLLALTKSGAHIGDTTERLVTQHRLQPFAAAYFDGKTERLHSYDEAQLLAARQLVRGQAREWPSLFTGPLTTSSSAAPHDVGLDDLAAFFRQPAEYLLRHRLRIDTTERDASLDALDPVEPDALELWALKDRILELMLGNAPDPEIMAILRASGQLPPGELGARILREHGAGVREIAARTMDARGTGALPSLSVTVPIGNGLCARGTIGNRFRGGLVHHQAGTRRARQLFVPWLHHLAHACSTEGPVESRIFSRAVGSSAQLTRLDAVREPALVLASLVAIRNEGLDAPLLFFPEASFAYARTVRRKTESEAFAAALTQWKDESERLSFIERAYGHPCPFSATNEAHARFAELARAVFDPMLDVLTEGRA
ncbi:MAG: exodeoxyribonuclease V subunit gamma [Myxococcales bacterium]|nr:exodeoxyribonuclease V subunit gamma [Myxococcales bacterium]